MTPFAFATLEALRLSFAAVGLALALAFVLAELLRGGLAFAFVLALALAGLRVLAFAR